MKEKKSFKILKKAADPIVKRTFKDYLYETGLLIIGSACYGVAMNMFLVPGSIVLGGATGISTTFNFITGFIPIGVGILIINVPLVLLSMRIFGFREMLKTILGIIFSSVFIDTMGFLPIPEMDPLLQSIFGGSVMGFGAGLLFSRGFTTGGSDLAAMIIKRRFKQFSTGKIMMTVDFIIIVGSALITQRLEGVLYSIVAVYSFTTVVDIVMGGADKAKLVYIISPKYSQIADAIFANLKRGVTVLSGTGWYTGEDKSVLMVVVKNQEMFQIKSLIHSIDPEAFIIFGEASEVMGYGFKASL